MTYRYAVIGVAPQGTGVIFATNSLERAQDVLKAGVDRDGVHWEGVRILDRESEQVVAAG